MKILMVVLLFLSSGMRVVAQIKPLDSYSKNEIKIELQKFKEFLPQMMEMTSQEKPLMMLGPIEPDEYTAVNESATAIFTDADNSLIIKLSKEKPEATHEGSSILLTKIEDNTVDFTLSLESAAKVKEIQAISENDNYLNAHSKSNNDIFPPQVLEILTSMETEVDTILANFDSYAQKDLVTFMTDKKKEVESQFTKTPRIKKYFLKFPGNVKELIIYLEK